MNNRQWRVHDLPPKWDGLAVDWEGWQQFPSTLDFHMRPKHLCTACASDRRPALNFGFVHLKNGLRSRHLTAFRCLDCKHDNVYDGMTRTWWDLDDNDYRTAGSLQP